MININVDFTKHLGKIKPMHAVNNMPSCPLDENGWDKRMQDAAIPFGRLHDTGGEVNTPRYVDIAAVFPNFDADENDPSSYDFAFTDFLINRMVKAGVMPYYRLGATIENYHFIKPFNIYPPKDCEKWARICEHIIMHYNEGWADGFRFGIKYWEIWNEPDNEPDIKNNPMWKGSMEDYFKLYEITATHLKRRFPDIKIGGYASCGFYALYDIDVSQMAHSTSRTEYFIEFFIKFLEYISERGLPLDFFSWHSYARVIDNVKFADFPREYLDKYGYEDTEIHLNEWNPGIHLRGKLKDASNIISMMIAMHDTPTDMLMYYDANYMSPYSGMVSPMDISPFKAYYAFYHYGKLYRLGTRAEAICNDENVCTLAATNGKTNGIVIANAGDEDIEITLSLNCDSFNAKAYITDNGHDFDEIAFDFNGSKLPANAIVYIEMG